MAALTYAQIKSSVLACMKTCPNIMSCLIYKDFEGNHRYVIMEGKVFNICYIQLKAVITRRHGLIEVITDRAGIQRELEDCKLSLIYGAF